MVVKTGEANSGYFMTILILLIWRSTETHGIYLKFSK